MGMTTKASVTGAVGDEVAAPASGHGSPGKMAYDYLLAGRLGDESRSRAAVADLAALSDDDLAAGLGDDDARLAFWIDVYNGAAMRIVAPHLETWSDRLRFMSHEVMTVAGEHLSLGAIEHGILRRSRRTFGLGYLRSWKVSPFEARHRVAHLDPRLHFALNCAAMSCPPIAAYSADAIDAQLELATRSYLAASVEMTGSVARVPQIFLWYHGDFRSSGGVRAFIREHGVDIGDRKLRLASWDWTPAPGVWVSDQSDVD